MDTRTNAAINHEENDSPIDACVRRIRNAMMLGISKDEILDSLISEYGSSTVFLCFHAAAIANK